MKQLITLLIAASLSLIAGADTAMTFKTIDGKAHTLAISGLTISFADNTLTASNTKTTISLPLEQMASMSFSETTSGITDINGGDSTCEPAAVFTISGISMGKFPSVIDAVNAIPPGNYLIQLSDGTTLKIRKQ